TSAETVCANHRTPQGSWGSTVGERDRGSFCAAFQYRSRDDGLRVSGGSTIDRQGIPAGSPNEEEHDRSAGTRVFLAGLESRTPPRPYSTNGHAKKVTERPHIDRCTGSSRSQPQEHLG